MLNDTRDTEHDAAAECVEKISWQWDHAALVFRGGAGTHVRNFAAMLQHGGFGEPETARLPLLKKIRDVIEERVRAGGSRLTAKSAIEIIKTFYSWGDAKMVTLTLHNVSCQFLEWAGHLQERSRAKEIKTSTAYHKASVVAAVLDDVLGREAGLIRQTRLKRRGSRDIPWRRHNADVEQTFQFGHALCDICDALTVEAVRGGSLPIKIAFKDGNFFEHWCGLRNPEFLKGLNGKRASPRNLKNRLAWEKDTSLHTRWSVVNLRIQAELLIFVAQTGMNWSQVWKLRTGRFSYQSHLDGYLVRHVYKKRRKGEVAFEIHSEYRPYFERYLAWRNEFFPADEEDLLFPLICRIEAGRRRSLNGPCEKLSQVRQVCKAIGIQFINPRVLRKVRVNWLVRRSGDLDQTAEMSQHSKEVLLRNYLEPDPDVATVEISRFFQQNDPAFLSAGPGACARAEADPLQNIPPEAPQPDCVSPAGCLFCSNHRDINSADHAWSLVSYRYLKTIELATFRPPVNRNLVHPASEVIARVTNKINLFIDGSQTRQGWIEEAVDRVKEGDYHPMWDGFIELAEALL